MVIDRDTRRNQSLLKLERAQLQWQNAVEYHVRCQSLDSQIGGPDGICVLQKANRLLRESSEAYRKAMREYANEAL